MTNLLWVTLCMAWHGYYPAVFVKPHPEINRVESRFSAEMDKQFGSALVQLGQQMEAVETGK